MMFGLLYERFSVHHCIKRALLMSRDLQRSVIDDLMCDSYINAPA